MERLLADHQAATEFVARLLRAVVYRAAQREGQRQWLQFLLQHSAHLPVAVHRTPER